MKPTTIERNGGRDQDARVRALQDELDHARRLSAVGQLSASVVHELNNPIDGILRFVQLARGALDEQDPARVRAYLDRARDGLLRMGHITADLLEVSRRPREPRPPARLDDIIEDALLALSGRAREAGVQCVRQVQDCGRPVAAAGVLFQVVSNLFKNAIEAMTPGGGTLTVSARRTQDRIRMCCEDTGCGLPSDPERIFEPFYTSKPAGRGTGLGLAICRELVRGCGGRISARPRPGGGAILEVQMPDERAAGDS